MLINVPRLVTAYFTGTPDPGVPSQRVAFGTSGHRGSAFDNAFNEAHILAKFTTAPGNGVPFGGIKMIAESGWFAARPSGTDGCLQDLCRELPR